MENSLEEFISLNAIRGYILLGKSMGDIVSVEEGYKLLKMDKEAFMGLQIKYVEWMARINGNQIGMNSNYSDVFNSLRAVTGQDSASRIAAGYLISVTYLLNGYNGNGK
jgi:hypothetical protein